MLTYDKSFCWHEGLSKESVESLFNGLDFPVVGNSDSTNLFLYREIMETYPEAKFVLIDRDIYEVYNSLVNLGLMTPRGADLLNRAEVIMDLLKDNYDVLSIPFNEIDNRLVEIWNYCTGLPVNEQRLKMLSSLRIEVDMNSYINNVLKSKNYKQILSVVLGDT